MTKIKICGLRREEDIVYANTCMPDYVGFVFAKSRRQVTKEQALILRKKLREEIIPVGVFVNEDINIVADFLNCGMIDMAQLHGEESQDYIEKLLEKMNRGKLVKAVRVSKREDISDAGKLPVDYLLLDTFSKDSYGGTGQSFDWNMIDIVKKPYFLAGGIQSGNVKEALEKLHPFALDISSAVETNGYKDGEKMCRLVEEIRKMQQA